MPSTMPTSDRPNLAETDRAPATVSGQFLDEIDKTLTVRLAILGCGNVGGALINILNRQKADIAARTGISFEIIGVAVSDLDRERNVDISPSLFTMDAKSLVTRDDVDVVVEVMGGLDPARALVEMALNASKPVVTGNKALLAVAGSQLAELAGSHGVDLLYEAAVASAIPVIRVVRESLAGERIKRIMGILNGTTNFILTRMDEEGSDYGAALIEAQELGLAERDPAADVEGFDAASKAAILAGLAFGCEVLGADVYREGITNVRAVDVAFANRLGYVIKLLAIAEIVDGGPDISVRVHPAMVPRSHPLASVRGAFNAVFVEGVACGELMLYGRGAGGDAAASAVLGDLVDVAHNLVAGTCASVPRQLERNIFEHFDLSSAFYLSLDVADRPGVLAAVAQVFGNHGVSIRVMEQVGLGKDARLIFLTHRAREGDVQDTIEELGHLQAVDNVGGLLRVIDFEPS